MNFDSEVGTLNCSNPVVGTEGNCSPDCDSATAAASARMLSGSAFVDSSTPKDESPLLKDILTMI